MMPEKADRLYKFLSQEVLGNNVKSTPEMRELAFSIMIRLNQRFRTDQDWGQK